MVLMTREGYKQWQDECREKQEKEDNPFLARKTVIGDDVVVAIPDDGNWRFRNKEEAMRCLNDMENTKWGAGPNCTYIPRFKQPIIAGARAELNPEWVNAPLIAVPFFTCPNK